MWDLWWTKWHWDRFFSEFFGFPLSIYHSTVALQTHHLGNANVSRHPRLGTRSTPPSRRTVKFRSQTTVAVPGNIIKIVSKHKTNAIFHRTPQPVNVTHNFHTYSSRSTHLVLRYSNAWRHVCPRVCIDAAFSLPA
jgi:hypothetical protein